MSLRTKDIEDILRNLWVKEKEDKDIMTEDQIDKDYITELFKKGYINIDHNKILLSESGEYLGRELVRKHRIAETVVADLFLADRDEMEDLADQIEHVMSHDVEDNIMRILGYPKKCPHGHTIPPRDGMVVDNKDSAVPLLETEVGDIGTVSYIKTADAKKLQKIMNLGLLPGSKIQLIQKFPIFVFQLGNTQLAVDKELANEIYVVVESNEPV
ncbi:metal-dependent transcriptional regulator [Methanobrevibacter boviskoreani]|uniref:metal-dependent transcriptional regulator n=1 Tax=Methanobrevibacter boviskoreani TaxID=1348249 RepID=UPI0023A8762C|nr:metal-dependent transcriptional regulator [Methanobrevibacter boviskoreani]MCI6774962.1 metal-dependent transcriptional regulator [Methanobrevibacter boviskoreani]MDY5614179.1 metal-dependent transcriptional regulator [Methanobrevibacter boviskoreani]